MTNRTNQAPARKHRIAKAIGAAGLALSVVCAGASQAAARSVCMMHDDIENLLEKHKEAQVAIGLASNGSLIEVFSTVDGGSWSIVMTDPRGKSCVVAVGKDWDHRDRIVLGDAT